MIKWIVCLFYGHVFDRLIADEWALTYFEKCSRCGKVRVAS